MALMIFVPKSYLWWCSLLQTAIIPRLKAWIRKVVSEDEVSGKQKDSRPDAIEEAVVAAKAAAAAAADVAKASHEILTARNEG